MRRQSPRPSVRTAAGRARRPRACGRAEHWVSANHCEYYAHTVSASGAVSSRSPRAPEAGVSNLVSMRSFTLHTHAAACTPWARFRDEMHLALAMKLLHRPCLFCWLSSI